MEAIMEMNDAIAEVYETFSKYPLRKNMDACPCCVGAEKAHRLQSGDPATLTAEGLGFYAFKAITTWGRVEDYKHFLPRVLELALTSEGRRQPGMCFGTIAGKLLEGEFERWPQTERVAVSNFFVATWNAFLDEDPHTGRSTKELLPALSVCCGEVTPFLEAWGKRRSLGSALQLQSMIPPDGGSMKANNYPGGHWGSEAHQEDVRVWLLDPARKRQLEDALDRYREAPEADRLSCAIFFWEKLARDHGVFG
jgi:hypothetical protein